MKELDCRGLACPQPVLTTKDALDNLTEGQVLVIVDNEPAVGNVSRFARSQGCAVSVEPRGSDFTITVTKGQAVSGGETTPEAPKSTDRPKVVVKVAGRFMGQGSEELGRVLMKAFLKSLKDASIQPWRMVFYNGGVHLTVKGSEHLEAIGDLEKAGVEVFSCGTCLDYFGLKSELAVGQVTNMFEIIETLSQADRVVSP